MSSLRIRFLKDLNFVFFEMRSLVLQQHRSLSPEIDKAGLVDTVATSLRSMMSID